MKTFLLKVCKIGFACDIIYLIYRGFEHFDFLTVLYRSEISQIKLLYLAFIEVIGSFFTILFINIFMICFGLYLIATTVAKREFYNLVYALFGVFLVSHICHIVVFVAITYFWD